MTDRGLEKYLVSQKTCVEDQVILASVVPPPHLSIGGWKCDIRLIYHPPDTYAGHRTDPCPFDKAYLSRRFKRWHIQANQDIKEHCE